jgi:hypothetical protein
MVTDVQVIVEYLNTPDKEAYAYPLMGMVGTCLFLQLLVAYFQTRKVSKSKMAKEMLIVLTGLKPGFDAYQVAKGSVRSAGAVFDPGTELAITKGGEMVAESIPGGVSSLIMHCLSPSTHSFLHDARQVASYSSTCS